MKKLILLFTILIGFIGSAQSVHWLPVKMKNVSTVYSQQDSILVIDSEGLIKSRPSSTVGNGGNSLLLDWQYTLDATENLMKVNSNPYFHNFSPSGTPDYMRNLFIGELAGNLTMTTTAQANIGIGAYSGGSVTIGKENVGVGTETLALTTSGSYNTGFGSSALYSNATGERNTAIGRQAGVWMTTGSNNTFIGSTAGFAKISGGNLLSISNSVLIGSFADGTSGSTNEIAIGYQVEGFGSNTATLGNANITDTHLRGTIHAESPFEIDGKPFLHTTTGAATIAASGWTMNTFIGIEAGNYTNGGTGYLGSLNVGVGAWALNGLTTGQQNNMIGNEAGAQISSGFYNNGIGDGILYSLTTGTDNVAIGKNCLQNITTSSFNIAIGRNAGYFINSGANMTSATSGLYLGRETRASANGNTNETVIGYDARGNGSNTVTIGSSAVTDVHLSGDTHSDGYSVNAMQTAPASASATGTEGDIVITATFIYICTATDTWKRVAVATW